MSRAFHPTPPGLDASVPKERRQAAGSACALHGSSDRYLAKTKPNHSVAVADGLYLWESRKEAWRGVKLNLGRPLVD